jgi:hypothetical protein
MKVKHLLLSSVLALPALLLPLASCDDSKVPSEPAVDEPADNVDAPSFTVVGFGSFWHDPHIKGAKLRTFAGPTDAPGSGCTGQANRFRSQDGAEVRTDVTVGSDPVPCSYAGVYPADQKLRGKLLAKVAELDFSYAGGAAQGGSPRWSIPIDECLVTQEGAPGTPYPCKTDGVREEYAFADAINCNDGDTNVGTLNGEDQEACLWTYKGVSYPNWAAFVAAYPGAKVARKEIGGTSDAFYFVIIDRGPSHYLLFKVDAR